MIGERLTELRKDAGLTQEELGRMLNLSNFNISAYECDKNEPSDEVKLKIAEFFGVTTDYLMGKTDEPKPYVLQNKSIRIPKTLPETAEKEIKSFMDYLIYKYKRKMK